MGFRERFWPGSTASEEAVMRADGLGLITEPTHRMVDLPDGVIGAVLDGGMSFRDAMDIAATAAAVQAEFRQGDQL